MGRRGPPAKPTATKILEGTFRKDRAAKNEPKPAAATPSCPAWLNTEARREWRRIVPLLEQLNLLTKVDRSALAGYCQAYSRWRQAERILDAEGLTMDFLSNNGASYSQARPEVAIAQQSAKLMKTFLAEFGLTPASRTRISVPVKEPEKKDATRELLFGGKRRSS